MTNEEAVEILKELWRSEHTDSYSEKEIRNAIDLAIETLEKQIAKKLVDIHKVREVIVGKCPTCGEGANDEMKACACCGQLLDWSK